MSIVTLAIKSTAETAFPVDAEERHAPCVQSWLRSSNRRDPGCNPNRCNPLRLRPDLYCHGTHAPHWPGERRSCSLEGPLNTSDQVSRVWSFEPSDHEGNSHWSLLFSFRCLGQLFR
eukprot:s3831_g18.t1